MTSPSLFYINIIIPKDAVPFRIGILFIQENALKKCNYWIKLHFFSAFSCTSTSFSLPSGMAMQLHNSTTGLRNLGKVEKVYLDNTNLIYNLSPENADLGNVRETFFLNQTRLQNEVTFSGIADFQIGDFTFEVGGRHKGQQQIEQANRGFIVKDDIEFPMLNIIPLWHFGLNY